MQEMLEYYQDKSFSLLLQDKNFLELLEYMEKDNLRTITMTLQTTSLSLEYKVVFVRGEVVSRWSVTTTLKTRQYTHWYCNCLGVAKKLRTLEKKHYKKNPTDVLLVDFNYDWRY